MRRPDSIGVGLLATLLIATAVVAPAAAAPFTERWVTTGGTHTAQARIALSGDGKTTLIGSEGASGCECGSVLVFAGSGNSWINQAQLKPSEGTGEQRELFGEREAVSQDGNTVAVVGGGAVWVFTRSGTTWSQQGSRLTAGEGTLGSMVALSGDGNTVLVGGEAASGNVGAAWVFKRSGTTWKQQGPELTGTEELGEGNFGSSVAVSNNGNTAVIGGRGDDGGLGAAWVFKRSGAAWSQQGPKLTGTEELGEGHLGSSVAVSANGNTTVIGGPGVGFGAPTRGAAWVFTRSGTTWAQQGPRLTASEEQENGFFGSSVALAGDGDTALISGPHEDGAWVFKRSGSTWAQEGSKLVNVSGAENGEGPDFAQAVALSADSDTALVGGTGTAWIFVKPSAGPPEYGRCLKVASHGGFTSATCTVPSEATTGGYEWFPGVEHAGFTLGLKKGEAVFATSTGPKLTCATESGTGEYSGIKEVSNVLITLTGCSSGGHECTSEGRAPGELRTAPLDGTLGWEAQASEKVALDLYTVGQAHPFLEYHCTGVTGVIVVGGSILVGVTADRMLLTPTLRYRATAGVQSPESFEGVPADVLSLHTEGTIATLGETATLTQTNEEAVEINTIV